MTRQEQAAQLRADGLTYQQIAERVGVHRQTVIRWLKPDYAQSSRRSSVAWKDRNREANRARDNDYNAREDVRGRCTTCGGLMGLSVTHDGTCNTCRDASARQREQRFVDLYNSGLPLKEIAVAMGCSRDALCPLGDKVRRQGRIGYRYAGCAAKQAA